MNHWSLLKILCQKPFFRKIRLEFEECFLFSLSNRFLHNEYNRVQRLEKKPANLKKTGLYISIPKSELEEELEIVSLNPIRGSE